MKMKTAKEFAILEPNSMDADAPAEMDPNLEQLAKNLEWRFRHHPNDQVTTTEVQKLTPETAGLLKAQVRDMMGFYVKEYEDIRLASRARPASSQAKTSIVLSVKPVLGI